MLYATCPIQTTRVKDWCRMRPTARKGDIVRPFEAAVRRHSSGLFGEWMVGGVLKQEAGKLHVIVNVERPKGQHPPESCRWRARAGAGKLC